ncbi:MAG: substrate-binding domain-containing protein [Ethanoligenens sp.]
MTDNTTIKDVAKHAGVSIATVSRVLNNLGGYSQVTEQTVLQAIRELNYHQNTLARSLKTQHSNLLGFLLPVAVTTSLDRILYAFEKEAGEAGYQVLVCHSDETPADIVKHIHMLSRFQIDGFVFCGHQPGDEFEKEFRNSNTPCVLINSYPTGNTIPYLRVDDYAAAYASADYICKKGHHHIALLPGPKEDATAGLARLRGYQQAIADHGLVLQDDLIFYGDFSYHGTLDAARRLVQQKDRFTAVLAASDDMALAVLSQAYAHQVRVPDDFSVVGYDNVLAAEMAIPPLTTLAQPFEEMGRQAVQMLLGQMRTGKKPKRRLMPFKIIERCSVMDINQHA